MKKLLFLVCLMAAANTWAQQAIITTADFAKQTVPAVVLVLKGQRSNVETVWEKKLTTLAGVKTKSGKAGTSLLPQARISQISPNALFDFYTRVEKEGKSDSLTRVTLFLSLGGETPNFAGTDKFSAELTNAAAVMNELPREVKMYELQLAIDAQQKTLASAEESQRDLEKDQVSLEKKRDDLLRQLEQNKSAQERQRIIITNEKAKAESLKAAFQDAQNSRY